MCSLSLFPPPPLVGEVSFGESHLVTSHLNQSQLGSQSFRQVTGHPLAQLNDEQLNTSMIRLRNQDAFLQSKKSFWNEAALSWNTKGFVGILEDFCEHWQDGNLSYIAKKLVRSFLFVWNRAYSIYGSFYPHLLLSPENMVAKFSEASDWNQGIIRAFSWHPQTMKYAVALKDDSINVCGNHSKINPILKHKLQYGISVIAWNPYSASVLAVGCIMGVILWQIEPSSLVTRPSSNCVTLLKAQGHCPVSSISFHPDGHLLASASPACKSVMIWDVATGNCTPLQQVSGGGVSLIRWSPDGTRLLAASPSKVFKVWETLRWTSEPWTLSTGYCQAACWSPDGRILLFATSEDPLIYALTFRPAADIKLHYIGGSENATIVADTSPVIISNGQEERAGGRIQSIAWDKSGERLAVSFKDNPQLIAVYQTWTIPALQLAPCCFLRGPEGESLQSMAFQDSSNCSVLTLCWSNGQISNIPVKTS